MHLSTRAFREKLASGTPMRSGSFRPELSLVSLDGPLGRSSSGDFQRSRASMALTIKLFINYDLAESADVPSGKT